MDRRRVEAIALGSIAASMLLAGMQAAFLPESFFTDFPMGRGWIEADGGTYDEHLVRDVGALFLALIVVTVWSIPRQEARRPVAAAWLLQGLLHLTYHVGHLDGFEGIDKIGMAGSLVTVPLLAVVALWAGVASDGEPAPVQA